MTAVEDLARSVEALGVDVDTEQPLPELLYLLDSIRACRMELAKTEASVEAAAARLMPFESVELAGFVATPRGGNKYKRWQDERVADRIVTSLSTDPETGEVDGDTYHNAHLIAVALLEAASLTWRVTKLKARGIPYIDLVEIETGRRTVQISRSAP